MASAGRCSELHALVFDQKYIQFKHKGTGVTLTRNLIKSMIHGIFQGSLLTSLEFGAPNCPVRDIH